MRRRQFLSATLLAGAGCVELPVTTPDAPDAAGADGVPARGGAAPLAQDYAVVSRVPADGSFSYMHDPGMTLLPSGALLAAAPRWTTAAAGDVNGTGFEVRVMRSGDGGQTWAEVASFADTSDATPFVVDGRLYMFLQRRQFENVSLAASDDEGQTWTARTVLFSGSFWNCSTAMVRSGARLYWAVQSDGYAGSVRVLVADTTGDLLDPARWSISAPAAHPPTPPPLVVPVVAGAATIADWWLEPNVVEVAGTIHVFLRTVLANQSTAGVAMMCTLVDDRSDPSGLRLEFTRYCAVPGGQNKCFLLADGALYWMLSNLPADSQEAVLRPELDTLRAAGRYLGSGGNDRRFLMLSYSLDALDWFPAGCVARAGLLRQSFMYPSAVIDGDDLLVLSRTSVDGPTQHNADLVTFHRVRDFRSLAMNLLPDQA